MKPHPASELEAVNEGRGPLPAPGELQDEAAVLISGDQPIENEALHLGGDGVLRQPRVQLRGIGFDADDEGVAFENALLPAGGQISRREDEKDEKSERFFLHVGIPVGEMSRRDSHRRGRGVNAASRRGLQFASRGLGLARYVLAGSMIWRDS